MIKTPFMWAGSKDRDYPKIKPYLPDFKSYNEPFLGGGAVYFRLLVDRGRFKAHCSDVNEDLIATYETIRDDPKGLIAGLPPIKDKAVFKDFMSASPNTDKDRAIRFLYLNRNRFFGMGGWMNADRYARGAVIDRIGFLSPLMQSTTFSKSCWDCEFPEGSFTFCDPPYPDTNNSACYKIEDQEIMNLNMNYLSVMAETGENFFWVTKFSNEMFNHASCYDDLIVEKKEWIFRKPGKEPQVGYELYVSRKS
jgi:DNA adenine methylase